MRSNFTLTALCVGTFILISGGHAAGQPGPPPTTPVNGAGTPGTIPLWTGSGRTLTDSRIQDNGSVVTIQLPANVLGPLSAAGGSGIGLFGTSSSSTGIQGQTVSGGFGVFGTAASSADGTTGVGGNALAVTGITFGVQGFAHSPQGVGVQGNNDGGGNGVVGFSTAPGDGAGIAGFGLQYGVRGFVDSGTEASWAVSGVAAGNGVGVEGISSGGVGVRGNMLSCDDSGCTPTAGEAGQFVAGAGGILLHGFLSNFDGPGGWEEKFVVDAAGNLSIGGNAYKPGGGSWSILSDRRTKRSIEPINGALEQLLRLRGVTYEYKDPSALGESPGSHIGMVAQDVKEVFPSWVDTGADGYERVTFRGFEAVAVEALRELDVDSKAAEARIAELERQNAELRRAVDALSQAMRALQRGMESGQSSR